MAMSFSPATPVRRIYQQPSNKLTSTKALLSLQGSNHRGSSSVQCNLTSGHVSSLTAAASYVKLPVASLRKRLVSKQFSQKRTGIIKCATIEEIEAEKSSIEKNVKEKMEKTIENLRSNFNSVRTGRSNPAMLDKIEVEYYGSPVNLKTIAQISTPDASSLLVQPYDKSSLKSIEKAIVTSNLGLTPNNDGEVIRLSVPQLTSDRRKEMLKVVAKQAEEGKVALRNIRREAGH